MTTRRRLTGPQSAALRAIAAGTCPYEAAFETHRGGNRARRAQDTLLQLARLGLIEELPVPPFATRAWRLAALPRP